MLRSSWRRDFARRRTAAALAAVVGFVAGSARAGDDTSDGLSFQWRAADGCPDGEAGRAAIARYVGEGWFDPSHPVSVSVVLAPVAGSRGAGGADAGGWEGRVEVRTAEGLGARRFQGASCDEVAQAAALVLAIILDPRKAAAAVRADRHDAGAEAPEPRFEVGLQMGADIGSLPSATLGVGLQAGVRAGPALVGAQASYWVPERAMATGPGSSAGAGGAGGRIGLYSGGLLGCLDAVRSSAGMFRLDVCARGEIGAEEGSGFGIEQPSHTTAFWAAAFGGASAWLSSGSLRTAVSVEVGTPLVRPEFAIEGVGEVFRAAPVLVRLSSTVDWAFP